MDALILAHFSHQMNVNQIYFRSARIRVCARVESLYVCVCVCFGDKSVAIISPDIHLD